MSCLTLAASDTDWQTVKLGDVATLHYGKALPKTERNPSGQIPVYGANGIKDHADKQLTTGPTFVIGRKGSAGEITRVDSPFWPLDVTYYTTHDSERIEFDYLGYALSMLNLPSLARGVKPGINRNDIYELEILLPPLDEQKRIVVILDQALAALDHARANAEANLADAANLFDNTLHATFTEALSTSQMHTLSEAAHDFSRGKSRHRPRNDPKLYDGEYPFIQTGDVRRCDGRIQEYSQTYNATGLAQSKLWPAGTVCITIAANIAETGFLEFDACFPDSVIGMVPDPDVTSASYVEYMLRYFAASLKKEGKGSAQDNINLATFENAKFPFPTLNDQASIVAKLDNLAGAVVKLSNKYTKQLASIAALRQSILQKAFAGQLI